MAVVSKEESSHCVLCTSRPYLHVLSVASFPVSRVLALPYCFLRGPDRGTPALTPRSSPGGARCAWGTPEPWSAGPQRSGGGILPEKRGNSDVLALRGRGEASSTSAEKVPAPLRKKDWEGSGRTLVPAQKPQEHLIMAVQLMPESAVCLLMRGSAGSSTGDPDARYGPCLG
ncbi:unnamed protein product [Boreogadus saida]